MLQRPHARYAQPPPPHEARAGSGGGALQLLAMCALTLGQVCCAAALKRSLLEACDSYKVANRSSSSSSSSSAYNALVNHVLCILQDLAVQHLQVQRARICRPSSHAFGHTRLSKPACSCTPAIVCAAWRCK